MKNTGNSYFTTGEFAKLGNVTKDTLFHYDKIGILKPEIVKQNGYRYYSAKQFYDLDIINVLKAAGTALKDINGYMSAKNKETFLRILREKYEILEQEKKTIALMQYRLQKAIEVTEFAMTEPLGIPRLISCKEENLIIRKIENSKLTMKETISYLSNHFHYCLSKGLCEEIPVGAIIEKDTLLSGSISPSHYYSKISFPIDGPYYFLKPSGTYASILHSGYYDTIQQSYDLLMDFIKANHLKIIGNAYEYELINYLSITNNEDYIIQLSIQVDFES